MPLAALGSARRRGSPPTINFVVDGNSISTAAYSELGTLDNHLMLTEPLASSGATHSCRAVSGHSWAHMLATHGPLVDTDWDADADVNILVCWETRNSIVLGDLPSKVLTDISSYTTARKALNPWLILYVSTIPTGGSAAYVQTNQGMSAVDSIVAGNLAGYGFDAYVNLRVHPAFDHDGSTLPPFESYPTFWHETGLPYTHPRDPGKAILTPLISAAVADLAGL